MKLRFLGLALVGVCGLGEISSAAVVQRGTASVANFNITEADVLAAQERWGRGLIQISKVYDERGIGASVKTAEKVLDDNYGYNMGPVLFKPTLAQGDRTFRTTKEGALAYFVGQNRAYPEDNGFALKGWESFSVENAGIFINGNLALTTGNVFLTDKTGKVTMVNKTWGFKKDPQGKVRIVLHHSSLPFSAN